MHLAQEEPTPPSQASDQSRDPGLPRQVTETPLPLIGLGGKT